VPFLTLSLFVSLSTAALLVWALQNRVRTFTLGLIALFALLIALAATLSIPLIQPAQPELALTWLVIDGRPIDVRFVATSLSNFIGPIILLCGAVLAGGLTWTVGQSSRAFGLVFSGLLILVLGGLLAIYIASPLGVIVGLGMAWLGSTIMQQMFIVHNRDATIGGLPLLLAALVLLTWGATPQLAGGTIMALPWLAGCGILMFLGPRNGLTPAAPLLVRGPSLTLGLPLIGGFAFVRYAIEAADTWDETTRSLVLIVSVAAFILAAINALVAQRFGNAWTWQMLAQLSLLAICFGTGQPAAGPIATGLLAHTLVIGTSMALALGQLERVTRTDVFAALPPLPQPLRRAGLAYGLAAVSAAGFPPSLGYALRRVVLLLVPTQPWLPPLLLGASTLLALSYLPTLVAFFRRPVFRSPLASVDQRGDIWPLALMLGLFAGGLVPDNAWQVALGDPSANTAQPPAVATWLTTAGIALCVVVLVGIINRTLRHPRAASQFIGGEALDEEPGWTLPFTALRTVVWPLVVPERQPFAVLSATVQRQRKWLSPLRQTLERRYYLAVVVVSLISVLLLAMQ